jgi:hypothetical protein
MLGNGNRCPHAMAAVEVERRLSDLAVRGQALLGVRRIKL